MQAAVMILLQSSIPGPLCSDLELSIAFPVGISSRFSAGFHSREKVSEHKQMMQRKNE